VGDCSFAYSALASFRMGMSESLRRGFLDHSDFLLRFLEEHDIGIVVPPQNSKAFAVR
jgi:hypothetical protein